MSGKWAEAKLRAQHFVHFANDLDTRRDFPAVHDLAQDFIALEQERDGLKATIEGVKLAHEVAVKTWKKVEEERDRLKAEWDGRCEQVDEQQQWLDEINVALGPCIVFQHERLARIEALKSCLRETVESLSFIRGAFAPVKGDKCDADYWCAHCQIDQDDVIRKARELLGDDDGE